MNKETLKKIKDISSNVLLGLFIAICIFSLALTIFAKKDKDGTAEIFGYQLRIVVSGSMEKCDETDVSDFKIKSIPIRSMVFVEMVPEDTDEAKEWYDDLEVGDVLTFKYVYASQVTITHRIISIEEKGEGYIIKLEGDNKSSEDNQGVQIINTNEAATSPNYIVGKVVGQAKLLGFILSIMKEPVGLICLIIIPCAIVIILEILKITSVLNEEKLKKANEENKKRDDELEELRKKLADLQSASANSSAPVAEPEAMNEPEVEESKEVEEAEEVPATEEAKTTEEVEAIEADEATEEVKATEKAETTEEAEATEADEAIEADEATEEVPATEADEAKATEEVEATKEETSLSDEE